MKKFYCYIENGEPVIVEEEKGNLNMREMPHFKAVNAPNEQRARDVYIADLRIKIWQSA